MQNHSTPFTALTVVVIVLLRLGPFVDLSLFVLTASQHIYMCTFTADKYSLQFYLVLYITTLNVQRLSHCVCSQIALQRVTALLVQNYLQAMQPYIRQQTQCTGMNTIRKPHCDMVAHL